MLRCKQSGVRGRSVLGVSLDRVVSKETLPPRGGRREPVGDLGKSLLGQENSKGM